MSTPVNYSRGFNLTSLCKGKKSWLRDRPPPEDAMEKREYYRSCLVGLSETIKSLDPLAASVGDRLFPSASPNLRSELSIIHETEATLDTWDLNHAQFMTEASKRERLNRAEIWTRGFLTWIPPSAKAESAPNSPTVHESKQLPDNHVRMQITERMLQYMRAQKDLDAQSVLEVNRIGLLFDKLQSPYETSGDVQQEQEEMILPTESTLTTPAGMRPSTGRFSESPLEFDCWSDKASAQLSNELTQYLIRLSEAKAQKDNIDRLCAQMKWGNTAKDRVEGEH